MTIFSPPHPEDGARWAGMRVGLLGGSFDPPHEGHLHVSLTALSVLDLDAIWWLVSPQNPLKEGAHHSFEERFRLCRALVQDRDPRIVISDLERHFGTALTWQTIRALNIHFSRAHFVWVTGMDNALTMHRWNNWTYILDHVATAHVARPPAWSLIESCPLKALQTQTHVYLERAARVPLTPRRSYWLMQKKMLDISSTGIRQDIEFIASQY